MPQTAREIHQAFSSAGVPAEIHGNADAACDGISSIEEVRPGSLIFVERARDVSASVHSAASIAVMPHSIMGDVVPSPEMCLIAVSDIRRALPVLLEMFNRRPRPPEGIHASAVIGKRATVGKHVSIGAYAVIGEGCEIGDGAVIEPHASVGAGSVIGAGAVVFAGARVYDGVRIGARCRIHSGAVIGSDGYGYVTTAQGHQKVAQIGGVRIEDDVEIGANVTIDRGAIGDTVVGRGTKIDNLVHLAHNVRIGEHALIVAQSGVAGSTKIGNWTVLAAQSGVTGHIHVGDRTMIGARSGVTKPIKSGQIISGFPARPHGEEKRIKASMGRLPELVGDVTRLKAAILRLSRRLSALERVSCSTP